MLYNIWNNPTEDNFDIEPIGCNLTIDQSVKDANLNKILKTQSYDTMIFLVETYPDWGSPDFVGSVRATLKAPNDDWNVMK